MKGFRQTFFSIIAAFATKRAKRGQGIVARWLKRAERWGAEARISSRPRGDHT